MTVSPSRLVLILIVRCAEFARGRNPKTKISSDFTTLHAFEDKHHKLLVLTGACELQACQARELCHWMLTSPCCYVLHEFWRVFSFHRFGMELLRLFCISQGLIFSRNGFSIDDFFLLFHTNCNMVISECFNSLFCYDLPMNRQTKMNSYLIVTAPCCGLTMARARGR